MNLPSFDDLLTQLHDPAPNLRVSAAYSSTQIVQVWAVFVHRC